MATPSVVQLADRQDTGAADLAQINRSIAVGEDAVVPPAASGRKSKVVVQLGPSA